MDKGKNRIIEIVLLLIITIPAFISLLNNQYFSIHDDQHIARLFLLDRGLRQGYLYPRWVDWLGFGFGYPLYNFYPPLIYYLAELFHLVGFSLIWSVKLIIIIGFILASLGIYFFIKSLTGKKAAFLGVAIYTYFFYHAVTAYVRGSLAEFFGMSLIPFVFLALKNLAEKPSIKQSIILGLTITVLILNHLLVAFPAMIFLSLMFIYYFFLVAENKRKFMSNLILALFIGISLSSFFWLPSIIEKKYTLVDNVLTKELANYKIHYVFPQQFWYSPWGYGGSTEGLNDGMTFQLGKVNFLLIAVSIVLSLIYLYKKKKLDSYLKYFYFFIFLFVLSLFMTTSLSSFIWDRLSYLWYLQFPWRFLCFSGFFTAIIGSYSIFFVKDIIDKQLKNSKLKKIVLISLTAVFCLIIIFKYYKYFRPQNHIRTNDIERTSFEEIAWRISNTSFEFIPKDVKTKKSQFNTTVLDIDKNEISQIPYKIISGQGKVEVIENKLAKKLFMIEADSSLIFQVNTYNFPGWQVYLDGKKTRIEDKNKFKLMSITVPQGNHQLRVIFLDTLIRKIANYISILSLLAVIILSLRSKNTSAGHQNN